MKIAVAQINPTIGALHHNAQKIIEITKSLFDVDMVVFPEMSLTGYPPKDLILRSDFLQAGYRALDKIAKEVAVPVLLGAGIKEDHLSAPYNAAVLCADKSWRMVAKKILLPNYNVFDDKRYFATPDEQACSIITVGTKRLLVSICEDAWASISGIVETSYHFDPIENALKNGVFVDAIINMSASPFSKTKPHNRSKVFRHLAKTYKVPVFVSGQVGANDQLLFDGHSMIVDRHGEIVALAKHCVPDILIGDLDNQEPQKILQDASNNDQVLIDVLAMGIRDYVEKCGAKGVLLGLSGGIDSAVCAALCVQALGADHVRAFYLPSRFSSEQSHRDAHILAHNLSIRLDTLPIEDGLGALRSLVQDTKLPLDQYHADIVDQNLQSRLRGLLLMAASNSTDYLMVATSNKSELAVGYATIYGDMCGAFSPLGDVYKTQVYGLAHRFNVQAGREIIPHSIIERLPSAELKPNQLDTDSLPDYGLLDKILYNFIDLEKSKAEIEALGGIDGVVVERVMDMVAKSEYKRRQGPLAFMVSDKVFGDARRLPIAKRVPRF